jgi:Helicase conserved C-terminal domain
MKLAELDWMEVLHHLPRWEALSPAARRAFLEVKPGVAAPPEALGAALDELLATGFVTRPGPKGRMYPHAPELRPLLVALRAMVRARPLDGPGGTLPEAYVQDQLTMDDTHWLAGERDYHYWVDRRATAALVSSADWVKGFLAAGPGTPMLKWEQARIRPGEPQRLALPQVAEPLHRLVKALTAHAGGVPLGSLAALLPDASPAHRAAALAAGLRYLLVFVSLRGDGCEAVLGVLPCIVRRLGPPPPPPAPAAAAAELEAPFMVADMTAVLVEAAGEPIRVRGNDLALFARAQQALAARLLRLPAWTERFIAVQGEELYAGAPDEEYVGGAGGEGLDGWVTATRIAVAVDALRAMGLAVLKSREDRLGFEATSAGRAWLGLPEGERLKQLLDPLRASPQRNPGRAGSGTLDFFGIRLPFALDEKTLDLRGALSTAFLSLPAKGMVAVDAFVRYHSQEVNPFTGNAAAGQRQWGAGYGTPRTREGWESLWGQILAAFLRARLLPLGGASLGRADGGVAFALTDAGRYLLGGTDAFEYAVAGEGEVVVQPDFEIVFLSAAPRVEAELARFAERTGTGVGALFRITRASVLRAAELGVSADRVLKTLGAVSRTPVPANVARQLRDWFGATRRVRIRPAVLVECPDTETAARVTGLGGAQVTAVTRTVLRLDGDARSVATLVKKLRTKGIFVQE